MQARSAADLPPKERCREELRLRILSLVLPPAADLDENRIAAEYGLSRTPLREVFQGLAGQGFLQLSPNRGARVATLEPERLRALHRTFPVLFVTCARLAAGDRGAAPLQELAADLARFEAREDDREMALHAHEILLRIGAAPGNLYLRPALERCLIDYTRLTLPLYAAGSKKDRKGLKKARQQLSALVGAILAGDETAAAEAAQAHWDAMQARLVRYLRPDAPPIPDLPDGIASGEGR